MILFAALACALSPDQFQARLDALICSRSEECEPDSFDDYYVSQDACVEEWDDGGAHVLDCRTQACAFDVQAARACLDAVRTSECAQFEDGEALGGCIDAWVECDQDVYSACLMGPV